MLLFDGAFGTYYSRITGSESYCELACLTDPDIVSHIHREYIEAGAEAIKTNTFGANTTLLDNPADVSSIIKSAWKIARAAADAGDKGGKIRVFADIGPIMKDDGNCRDEYRFIADEFLALGAKDFLFETMPEYDVLTDVFRYIKSRCPDSFIIASFATDQDGYTKKGLYYKDIFNKAAANEDVDVIGLNCVCGPAHISQLIKNCNIKEKPLSVMPNSGYPSMVGGRITYLDNTEYFAEKVLSLIDCGVSYVGGCCGTTPAHISALRKRLNGLSPSTAACNVSTVITAQADRPRNAFRDKLLAGKQVITVELDPPVDADTGFLLDSAKILRDAGADTITFADSPLARSRADSFITAAKVKRDTGVDVIPHLSCRDKNLIGIKSTLLGGKIESIDNVLVVTGDPVPKGDRNDIKGVFSLNSLNMMSYIRSLNQSIFSQAPYFIGAALNINAHNFKAELTRALNKEANGAEFFMTQPVYDDYGLSNLMEAKATLRGFILVGIMPVANYRNAVFLNNEVSGVNIPADLVEALKDKSNEEAEEISVGFCLKTAQKARPFCHGYYIMTPLKRVKMVEKIIGGLK